MKTCFWQKLTEPTGLAIADLCDYYNKGMIITRINVPKEHRGKGIARALLQEILTEADKNKVKLYLEIQSSDGLTAEQLAAWYRRHGFKGNMIGVLVRKPLL